MQNLFEIFSQNGGVSPLEMALLLVEPILVFCGYIFIFFISTSHYRRTNNRGGLIISISLLFWLVSAAIYETVLLMLESSSLLFIEISVGLINGFVFVCAVYGFKLICQGTHKV
jgi:hypothetical protein